MDLVENDQNTVEGDVQNTEPKEQEQAKTYSQEEVDAIKKQINENNQKAWDKRWAKEHAKIEQQNAKAKELLNLQMEQSGAKDIDELLENAYTTYGVERPKYTKEDVKTLGMSDAQRIKEMDLSDVEEEVQRLASSKRTDREDVAYSELNKYLNSQKQAMKHIEELKEAGADEEILNNNEFKDFAKKFNDSISYVEIYGMYNKMHPKKEPYKPGSAKGTKNSNTIKPFYTYEESLKYSKKDYDDNPELFKAVCDSMTKWGRKEGV